MFDFGSLVGGGISAISNLIGGAQERRNIKLQIAAQKEENERNRAFNKQLASEANNWSVEQWNRENDYRSPANQMKQMRDAGLNPDLAMSSGGLSPTASSSPSVSQSAPSNPTDMSSLGRLPTFGSIMANSVQSAVGLAQARKLNKESGLTDSQTKIAETESKYREQILQGSVTLNHANVSLADSSKEWNTQQIKQSRSQIGLLNTQVDKLYHDIEYLQAQTVNVDSDTWNKRIVTEFQSREANARIANMAAMLNLKESEVRNMTTELLARLPTYAATEGQLTATASYLQELTRNVPGLRDKISAENDRLHFDLKQDSKFSSSERTINMISNILKGVSSLMSGSGIMSIMRH